MTVERIGTNSGHGHVWARPDGVRARCGGEALCAECRADMALVKSIPAKRKVRKTPGLIGLERFVDNIGRYIETGEIDTDAWNEAVDNWCADLDDSAREGMKLLVRVALAAREWDKATFIPGFDIPDGPAAGLRRCVKALDEWEWSL